MKFRSAFILLCLSLSTLGGCKAFGGKKNLKSADGGGSTEAHDRTRWAVSAFPLDVRLADTINEDFYNNDGTGTQMLQDLLDEWDNQVPGIDFFVPVALTTNKDYPNLLSYRDSEMGVYISTNWFNNVTSNAIAITQWYGFNTSDSRGKFTEIIHADVILNDADWSFKTDPNVVSSNYYMPQVILHELGHLLGLNHLTPPFGDDAVMKPYMDTDEKLDTLLATDIDGIIDLYDNVSPLLAGTNAKAIGASKRASRDFHEDEVVRGVIELMADGECVHKIEDKVIYRHQLSIDLTSFKRKRP